MMATAFTERQLDSFHKAAASLKLFSRAELNDEQNRSLVEKLYVDPLPNEQAFKTLLGNSTTIITGRKGTGKSTVFQRVQREIRKNRLGIISAYMDIRNVFESSQVDIAPEQLAQFDGALTHEQIRRLLLHKRFFHTVITDIRNELRAQVEQNFLSRMKERVRGTVGEVFSGLDAVIANLDQPHFENVDALIAITRKLASGDKANSKASASVDVGMETSKLTARAKSTAEIAHEDSESTEEAYSQVFMRVMGINDVITELKNVMAAIDVRFLYIFLDDFSELPEDAMKLLVDSLIAPMARWSEFIKFKIAAYPGRVYLGSLDKTKIEEFHLDIFGLYGSSGVTKMEEKAMEFVQRLVEKRLTHFCKAPVEAFFSARPMELWRTLFYASMGNPRTLGHIMLYAYESHLLYGNKIGIAAIQEAAQRYYEEKIAPFFTTGQYRVSFTERSSIFSLKELLESIVSRARALRQEDRSARASTGGSRSHSSHFYVAEELEDLLSSLELAFFVTKYFEQSDRAGRRVSIYALNYGLCVKYQIAFGRPSDRREDRLYYVDRAFDYNALLRAYMAANQEIICDNCEDAFDISMLPSFKTFRMRCPQCETGTCRVVNLSKKYGDMLEAISPDLLLPETELGILQTLHSERREMVASEIAGELDCSGQLVGRRARHLADKTLVRRKPGPVFSYEITKKAEAAYFANDESAELNLVPQSPSESE